MENSNSTAVMPEVPPGEQSLNAAEASATAAPPYPPLNPKPSKAKKTVPTEYYTASVHDFEHTNLNRKMWVTRFWALPVLKDDVKELMHEVLMDEFCAVDWWESSYIESQVPDIDDDGDAIMAVFPRKCYKTLGAQSLEYLTPEKQFEFFQERLPEERFEAKVIDKLLEGSNLPEFHEQAAELDQQNQAQLLEIASNLRRDLQARNLDDASIRDVTNLFQERAFDQNGHAAIQWVKYQVSHSNYVGGWAEGGAIALRMGYASLPERMAARQRESSNFVDQMKEFHGQLLQRIENGLAADEWYDGVVRRIEVPASVKAITNSALFVIKPGTRCLVDHIFTGNDPYSGEYGDDGMTNDQFVGDRVVSVDGQHVTTVEEYEEAIKTLPKEKGTIRLVVDTKKTDLSGYAGYMIVKDGDGNPDYPPEDAEVEPDPSPRELQGSDALTQEDQDKPNAAEAMTGAAAELDESPRELQGSDASAQEDHNGPNVTFELLRTKFGCQRQNFRRL